MMLSKDLREVVRTWRIWVLPLISLAMGLLSPVFARIAPALLEATTEGTGVTIAIPEPTVLDAYLQWSKNLSQVVLVAVVITASGTISGEVRRGTAQMMLVKPVSRPAFLVARLASELAVAVFSAAIGALGCWAMTAVLFEVADVWPLLRSTLLWLAFAALVISVMVLLSAWLDSTAGAAGVGVASYFVAMALSGWTPARDFSPLGLITAGDRLLAGGSVGLVWPLVTALGLTTAVTLLAIAVFSKKEI